MTAAWSAITLWACSVPVFRYALEKWPADPYRAIVFHHGPLSEAQQAQAYDLGADGQAGQLHANISLRTVDLDQRPEPEMLDLWRNLGTDSLPWLVVKYPLATRLTGHLWSGPLAGQTVRQLLDSPARREIVQRLAQGESAAWVLLESGDPKKDGAAAKLLESRLAYLGATLQLPKLDLEDIVNGLVSVPEADLRLEFSLLRLSRHDPEEHGFIQMLLGVEADLKQAKEPIVFPVFGRGRALYALVGQGISRETIDRAASFLIGKCSCEVKEQNPGVDLLLAADWDALVKMPANNAPDLPPLAELAKSAPVTVTLSGTDAGSGRPGPFLGNLYITGGFALAVLIAAGFLLRRKAAKNLNR